MGDPPLIAPPERHEDIWAVQREPDFPGYVRDLPRPEDPTAGAPGAQMPQITERFGRLLDRHTHDQVLDNDQPPGTT